MHPRRSIFQRWFGQPALLAALLLFAFFPTLSFLGHWDALFLGRPGPEVTLLVASGSAILNVAAQQTEEAEHAEHCHTDLGSCSGQPMPAGTGLFTMREILVRPPAVAIAFLKADVRRLHPLLTITPPTPPPRAG